MLPRENRLSKKSDIERIWRRGANFSFGNIRVKVLNNNLLRTRFAFLINKRAAKSSVQRNRIKRVLRNSFRLWLPQVKTGYDIIIYCGQPSNGEFKFSSEQAENLLKKIKLLRKA